MIPANKIRVTVWSLFVGALITCCGCNTGSGPRSVMAAPSPASFAMFRERMKSQPPQIFFTDLDSGPNSGGENVKGFAGAYVTLYGNFFGSSQADSTVTWNDQDCLRVVPSVGSYGGWGAPYLWYQKLVVQLGPRCRAGSGAFVVKVKHQSSNAIPFTVRSGQIFCVSTTGNDGKNGKFPTSCWSSMVKARKAMAPGDITYIQDGVVQAKEDDYDSNLAIQSNGTAGRPIALVAYPGATVTIGSANGKKLGYALRTPNIGGYHFWTLAGLTVRSASIGVEVSDRSSDFRVIAIDASCPTAIGKFQGACMDTAMGASNIRFLGNYDHDNAQVSRDGDTKGFHNMYFSTDTNHVEAAWNLIDGDTGQGLCSGGPCNSCRGIQFHSSPTNGGGSGDPSGRDQFDLHVHDNVIRNTHCDGINFATVDPSQGPVEAYNNVIYHTGTGVLTGRSSSYACIYFAGILNNGPAPSGTAQVYNNTCYDFDIGRDYESGAFAIFPSGTIKVNFHNNIVYALSRESYVSPSSLLNASAYTGSNNLFFGDGSPPSFFSSSISKDPKFVDAKTGDFHLLAGSPAIDSGLAVKLATDNDGVRRPQGHGSDIGAYEFSPLVKTTSAFRDAPDAR